MPLTSIKHRSIADIAQEIGNEYYKKTHPTSKNADGTLNLSTTKPIQLSVLDDQIGLGVRKVHGFQNACRSAGMVPGIVALYRKHKDQLDPQLQQKLQQFTDDDIKILQVVALMRASGRSTVSYDDGTGGTISNPDYASGVNYAAQGVKECRKKLKQLGVTEPKLSQFANAVKGCEDQNKKNCDLISCMLGDITTIETLRDRRNKEVDMGLCPFVFRATNKSGNHVEDFKKIVKNHVALIKQQQGFVCAKMTYNSEKIAGWSDDTLNVEQLVTQQKTEQKPYADIISGIDSYMRSLNFISSAKASAPPVSKSPVKSPAKAPAPQFPTSFKIAPEINHKPKDLDAKGAKVDVFPNGLQPGKINTFYAAFGKESKSGESYAQKMFRVLKAQLAANPGGKVAITYAANSGQIADIYKFNKGEQFSPISGAGQAPAFGKLQQLIKQHNLQKEIHILPVTSTYCSDSLTHPQEIARDMEYIAEHIGQGYMVLGLKNQGCLEFCSEQDKKKDPPPQPFAIGSSNAVGWTDGLSVGPAANTMLQQMEKGNFQDTTFKPGPGIQGESIPANLQTAFNNGKSNILGSSSATSSKVVKFSPPFPDGTTKPKLATDIRVDQENLKYLNQIVENRAKKAQELLGDTSDETTVLQKINKKVRRKNEDPKIAQKISEEKIADEVNRIYEKNKYSKGLTVLNNNENEYTVQREGREICTLQANSFNGNFLQASCRSIEENSEIPANEQAKEIATNTIAMLKGIAKSKSKSNKITGTATIDIQKKEDVPFVIEAMKCAWNEGFKVKLTSEAQKLLNSQYQGDALSQVKQIASEVTKNSITVPRDDEALDLNSFIEKCNKSLASRKTPALK